MSGIFVARVERPVAATLSDFVESYQSLSSASAPLPVWERLVYSIALLKNRSPEKKCTAADVVTHA